MNNKAQLSFIFGIIFFLVVIVAFALIDPFKESLDANRGGDTLNCPNTATFNQTAYDAQNTFEKLTYRPTCFVTGISLVWFIGAILIYGAVWVFDNWTKITNRRRTR